MLEDLLEGLVGRLSKFASSPHAPSALLNLFDGKISVIFSFPRNQIICVKKIIHNYKNSLSQTFLSYTIRHLKCFSLNKAFLLLLQPLEFQIQVAKP